MVERFAFEFWPGMAAGDRPVRGMPGSTSQLSADKGGHACAFHDDQPFGISVTAATCCTCI